MTLRARAFVPPIMLRLAPWSNQDALIRVGRRIAAGGIQTQPAAGDGVVGRVGVFQGQAVPVEPLEGDVLHLVAGGVDQQAAGRGERFRDDLRAVHYDQRFAGEAWLRGAVNDHAVRDERWQVAGKMDVEDAIAVTGVARRDVEFDHRPGMIGDVIHRRAQAAGADIGGGGDDVGERHGRRAVKIGQRRAVAGAEAEIAHAKLVARENRPAWAAASAGHRAGLTQSPSPDASRTRSHNSRS